MLTPTVRATHAVWRHPGWQLLIISVVLIVSLAAAYFLIASIPGVDESAGDTSEERLIVLGAAAAAAIAIWGVSGQWSISSRELTIQFLRQIETDRDFIRALSLFNKAANTGDLVVFSRPFKKPKNWKRLSRDDRRKMKSAFYRTRDAITIVLNADELIAIGVKNSILDYRLVCAYRRQTTIRRWARAKDYIGGERTNTGLLTIWIELERLALRMQEDPYHNII